MSESLGSNVMDDQLSLLSFERRHFSRYLLWTSRSTIRNVGLRFGPSNRLIVAHSEWHPK